MLAEDDDKDKDNNDDDDEVHWGQLTCMLCVKNEGNATSLMNNLTYVKSSSHSSLSILLSLLSFRPQLCPFLFCIEVQVEPVITQIVTEQSPTTMH